MDARWQALAESTGLPVHGKNDLSPQQVSELSLPLLWTVLILAGIALTAGLVIIWLGRSLKKPAAAADSRSAGDQLAYFRLLYEQGECSREEYERIRTKLGQRLRQQLDLPAQPASSESPAPAEDPAGPSSNGPAT